MPSPATIKAELAETIQHQLAEKGELSREQLVATLSLASGYNNATINRIIDNLERAKRIAIIGDKILPAGIVDKKEG